jgi:hypothetical protein
MFLACEVIVIFVSAQLYPRRIDLQNIFLVDVD